MMSEDAKSYKAIRSASLSKGYDNRYVIVDTETGEILDDAQGDGYKTPQKAYASYGYKNRSTPQIQNTKSKKAKVREFCKTHKSFCKNLEQDALEIVKGSWGPEDRFDAAFVKEAFKEAGYDLKELGFTAGDFLRYW